MPRRARGVMVWRGQRGEEHMGDRPGRWRVEAAMAGLGALMAVVVFAGSLRGGWVYDDPWLLHRNRLITEPGQVARALTSDIFGAFAEDGAAKTPYWRPTWTAWMLGNHRLFGLEDATPWRVMNLGLHVLVTVLAYAVMRRLGVGAGVACGAACVLAVHPTRVEAVAWVSGAPDLLMGAALLGSLLCVLAAWGKTERGRWERGALAAAALGLYGVGLGAKEPALLFPLVVFGAAMAVAGAPRGRRGLVRAAAWAGAFLAVAMIFFVARWRVLGGGGTLEDNSGAVGSVLSLPRVVLFYLGQAFVPTHLGPVHGFGPVREAGVLSFALPLVATVVIGAAVVWAARRWPAAAVGAALFGAVLAPALAVGWMTPGLELQDRYLYVPLIGLVIAGAAVVSGLLEGRRRWMRIVCGVGAAAACVVMAWQTVRYSAAWESDESLWGWAVRAEPDSRLAWEQYGRALMEAEKPAEAVEAMGRSLQIAEDAGLRCVRAGMLVGLKRYDEAERELGALLEVPGQRGVDVVAVVEGLSRVWVERDGDVERALGMCRDARGQMPAAYATMTVRIAAILAGAGRTGEAVAELESAQARAAVEKSARSKLVFYQLGRLYAQDGRVEASRAAFIEFLRLTGSSTDRAVVAARRAAAGALNGAGVSGGGP